MLNAVIRYHPIIQFIRKNKPGNICEVGSGPDGLGMFLNIKFVGCDIEFPGKINRNMVPVKADARKLPFPDNTFDLVFSLDTIEHIKAEYRETVINEMYRIAKRYLILGFPCDSVARNSDLKVKKFCNILNLKEPPWINEHLTNEYPMSNKFYKLFKKNHWKYYAKENAGIIQHTAIVCLESLPLLFIVTKLISKILVKMYKMPLDWFHSSSFYRKMFYIEKRKIIDNKVTEWML